VEAEKGSVDPRDEESAEQSESAPAGQLLKAQQGYGELIARIERIEAAIRAVEERLSILES
jgi:hypothetical protein